MNLLSIGAALGFVTLIFQEGHGADLLGIGTGPIESFVPVLMFAIVFGLSMDYEVFLISRVHEEWEHTHDASLSVGRGLQTTGRVITAAAAIMIVVFGSFAIGDDRVIKLFGIGLASAVFFDAVIIRCLLVPAIMELLGRRAWWLPVLARPPPAAARDRSARGTARRRDARARLQPSLTSGSDRGLERGRHRLRHELDGPRVDRGVGAEQEVPHSHVGVPA